MAKILYVEDDETLGMITSDSLKKNGYEIVYFDNGKDALEKINEVSADLYLLDVMLPKLDGYSLAREIRKSDSDTPILFITAKSLVEDRITGFKIGADDYIVKPYSIEELVLRINVFLKRSKISNTNEDNNIINIGAIKFNYSELTLTHDDTSIKLTQKEAGLLKYFVENKNKLIPREEILIKFWGKDDYFLGRSLDVFISRLRKYLKSENSVSIENRHGIGFVFCWK